MLDLNTPYSAEAVQLKNDFNNKSRLGTFATKNFTSAHELVQDSTTINTAGVQRIEGNTVFFKDGKSAEADAIMFNTGFTDDFAFLAKELQPSCIKNLFKNAFTPGHPGLAFVGWARPALGGVPICSEMVARYWMQLLDGERSLPSDVDVQIENDKNTVKTLYGNSSITTQVDLYVYMDELGALIGCRPSLAWLGTTDPRLLWKYLFGQHVPNFYRLQGPGANFDENATMIHSLPVCLTPWNVVKHATANLINSVTGKCASERFDFHEWFHL